MAFTLPSALSILPRALALATALTFASGAALAAPQPAEHTPKVRLVLLGTKGGPSMLATEKLPQSTALVVDDDVYLLDAGYGASLRLVQAKLPLAKLKGVFITHLHSDHIVDYPAVLMNSWASGLKTPVAVFGPPGTSEMTRHVWETFAVDIGLRIKDEGKPDPRPLVTAHDIDQGVVFDDGRLKVSALRVPHPPFADGQAFAYKFEVGGKTIVLSGDLTYFPPMADFSRNADVLINEVVHVQAVERLAARIGNGKTLAKAIISHHVTADNVGRIADAAHVKTLVLSHFVPADDPSITDADWRAAVGTTFKGPVIVGHDGMEIPLND
ncbi:MBL fold metallo-hydrolase [Pseudomonas putida]